MGLFNNVIGSYKESLRKDYLKEKSLKEVKALLEERGFTTSRIYGYKNVKRLTATNSERNRLDFIFSEKNRYIILNYGFSNSEMRTLELISSSKKLEEQFNPNKLNDDFQTKLKQISSVHFTYTEKTKSLNFNSMDVFLVKNEIYADSLNVKKMIAVNRMFNIRNKIMDFEIDKKKLKRLTSITGDKKIALFKRVSEKLFSFLYKRYSENGHIDMWSDDILGIFDIEFIKGSFFEEELFLKYDFTEEEFNDFFFNQYKEYVYMNIEQLILNSKEKNIIEREKEFSGWRIRTESDKDELTKSIDEMKTIEKLKSIKLIKIIEEKFFYLVEQERAKERSPRKSSYQMTDEIPF